jgi:hypothetical protein
MSSVVDVSRASALHFIEVLVSSKSEGTRLLAITDHAAEGRAQIYATESGSSRISNVIRMNYFSLSYNLVDICYIQLLPAACSFCSFTSSV